jgi:hypothetical protein
MKRVLLPVLLGAAVFAGCSRAAAPDPSAASKPASPKSITSSAKPEPTACDLVTADEMSAILGAKVTTEVTDQFTGQTTCVYTPASGFAPAAQLKIEWGMAQAVLSAAEAVRRVEPGVADPYAGIGDRALVIGGRLLIRKGDDLLTLSFLGVADEPAAAKRVYALAAKRLS